MPLRGIAPLRAYLIVDHARRRVERHWRDDAGVWQRDDIVGEGNVPVPCPELSVSLEEIYEGAETDAVSEAEPPAYGAAPRDTDSDGLEPEEAESAEV